jgi:hypothetical protein
MMDSGVIAALIGAALGILGAVIGTIVGLRSASSRAEHRYLIKWVIVFCFLIGGFFVGLWLVPAPHRIWIWLLYVLLLGPAIMACNRGRARFLSDRLPDG